MPCRPPSSSAFGKGKTGPWPLPRRPVPRGFEGWSRKVTREEEILEAVNILIENGLFQIKCYFLIGLPSETDDDVKAILLLAKKIRHQILSNRKRRKERWRLVLSVNPFIPKPATPFQWAPMEEVSELKRKLRMLQRGVRG